MDEGDVDSLGTQPVGEPGTWFGSSHACAWTGVLCADGRIVEIWVDDLQPSRPDPTLSIGTEPGALSELHTLRVTGDVTYPNSAMPLLVHGGGIQVVDPDLATLQSLETLELIGAGELVLPSELANLDNLRRLNLTGYDNTSVPGVVFELNGLDTLDLQLGELRKFQVPADVAWPELSRFFISESSLEARNISMGPLVSLEVLTIRVSPLGNLPPDILRQTQLRSLDLTFSELTSVDRDWEPLENLVLVDNRLSTLPESMFNAPLKYVELNSNQLIDLPQSIVNPDFSYLHVGANSLTSIPLELFDKDMDLTLANNEFRGDVSEVVNAFLSGQARLTFDLFAHGCVTIDDESVLARLEAENQSSLLEEISDCS